MANSLTWKAHNNEQRQTITKTYLVIDLDAFSWSNNTLYDASVHRPVLKAFTRGFLARFIFINVTV